jgi:hypothetical protein
MVAMKIAANILIAATDKREKLDTRMTKALKVGLNKDNSRRFT